MVMVPDIAYFYSTPYTLEGLPELGAVELGVAELGVVNLGVLNWRCLIKGLYYSTLIGSCDVGHSKISLLGGCTKSSKLGSS